jgi:hypothetical protein
MTFGHKLKFPVIIQKAREEAQRREATNNKAGKRRRGAGKKS